MKHILAGFLSLSFWIGFVLGSQAQDVVVNEYYNTATQGDEWTELIVVKDNLDLTGWFFGDNNQGTNSWQTKLTFKNHNLWKNLRAGTIITIDHGADDTECDDTYDYDKSDGYIRVCCRNTTYFSGGSTTTLFLADGGDFVHLVDPTGKHIHGIGHDDDPGSSVEGGSCFTTSPKWTNTTTAQAATRPCGNFLYYRFAMTAPQSLYVNAGTLADFSAGMQSSEANNFIKVSTNSYLGIGNAGGNSSWIISLRAPQFTADTFCYTKTLDNTVSFSWPAATDPFPSDGTIGYMVLRNLTGDFATPDQGVEYSEGAILGSGNQTAGVVKIITNSQTTTFSENLAPGNYFYRVYAFRYKNTPSFTHSTRGRTYNLNQFIQANSPGNVVVNIENDTLCGPGTAILKAFTTTSSSVTWFAAATGGQPLATSDTLTRYVSQTTSFWAEIAAPSVCFLQRYEVKAVIKPHEGELEVTTHNDTLCGSGFANFSVTVPIGTTTRWFEDSVSVQPISISDTLRTFRLPISQNTSLWVEVGSPDICFLKRYEVKAIIRPIVVDFTGPQSVCAGVPARLLSKQGNGVRYEFSFINPPQGTTGAYTLDSGYFEISIPEYPTSQTINYTIQAKDSKGCVSAIVNQTIVTQVYDPTLKSTPFDPEVGDLVDIELDSGQFYGLLSGWENFGGTIISSSQLKATFKTEDTSTVSAMVCMPGPADGCVCLVKRSIAIKPLPPPPGVIPNLILPGGEEVNQTFNFLGREVKNLEVFDRWGKKIFHSDIYKNDWKGDELVQGSTYFYKAEVKSTRQAEFETVSGWLQIVRQKADQMGK